MSSPLDVDDDGTPEETFDFLEGANDCVGATFCEDKGLEDNPNGEDVCCFGSWGLGGVPKDPKGDCDV